VVGEADRKPPRLHQDLVVTVPGRPPSLNSRRHWRAIAADNETWKGSAILEVQAAKNAWESRHGLRWRPLRLVRMNVAFVVPDHRHRDWDNLISTMKPELDAFVAAQVIVDDSTDVILNIGFEVEFEKGITATRFEIRELDE
jgi:Holliday junction resolvase RusA-like endonuclease